MKVEEMEHDERRKRDSVGYEDRRNEEMQKVCKEETMKGHERGGRGRGSGQREESGAS